MQNDDVRILIVEDNEVARKVLSLALNSMGCIFDAACTGIEAMQLFFNNEYDLILMDIGLPDINGITVTKLIKRYSNHKIKDPNIIAITAHGEETTKEDCINAGMVDFLIKPIDKAHLQEIIARSGLIIKPKGDA